MVSVSSHANAAAAAATHSSGKKLMDLAHVAIDNCIPPEDALVEVGRTERVAAGSTIAVVFVAMALVAESGARLAARGYPLTTFVSPNVPGVAPGQLGRPHNITVDPSGNIFVAEAAGPEVKDAATGQARQAGFRAQKFRFAGTK